MSVWQAIILGIIQGLTEFIPVSSSGHLVLFRGLLGATEGLLTFELFVHIGTALAVIVVFFEDFKKLILLRSPEYRKFALLLLLAIIPTAILGFFAKSFISELFSSINIVGLMLLITGTLLFVTNYFPARKGKISAMKKGEAFLIGLGQGLAVMPGISRSGTTIFTSLLLGLKREEAARFSFVLAVPTILGAGFYEGLELIRSGSGDIGFAPLFFGTLAAFLSGFWAVKFLLVMIVKRKLHYFAFYCWLVGLIIIVNYYLLT